MSLNASASSVVTLPYSFFQTNLPQISGQYVASDLTYKPITFSLVADQTFNTSVLASSQNLYGRHYYCYRAVTPSDMYVTGTAPYITFDVNLSFSNVTHLNTGIAAWCGQLNDNRILTYNMATLRQNFFTEYYFNGASSVQYIQSRPDDSSTPGYIPVLGDPAIYCGWNTTFENATGTTFNFGSSSVSTFWTSNGIWIAIIAPTINDDYVFDGVELPPIPDSGDDWGEGDTIGEVTGTIVTDSSGNQNISVTVETDNTGLIGGILNGIKRIFVPQSGFMDTFASDMQTEFSEHLGGVSEAVDLIGDQVDFVRNAVAASNNQIYFPGYSFTMGETSYQIINAQYVDLKPFDTNSSLHVLWEAVAFAVDLVCVLAVLNMLQTKYEIFLNPDGEVIDYDS